MGYETRTRTTTEVVEREETVTRGEVVETEEEVTVPVCDFCEQEYPEEGDGYLTPVVLNPQVEKGATVSETVHVKDRGARRADELREALSQVSAVDCRRKRVMEATADIRETPTADPGDLSPVTTKMRDDIVAYEFTVRVPEPEVRDDGQIMVCEHCEAQFKG